MVDPVFEFIMIIEPSGDDVTVENPALQRVDSLAPVSSVRIGG